MNKNGQAVQDSKMLEKAKNGSMVQDEQDMKRLGNEMKHMKTNTQLKEEGWVADPSQN